MLVLGRPPERGSGRQRPGWDGDRTQQLALGEGGAGRPGDEVGDGERAAGAVGGDEPADRAEGGGEGDHRSGGQRQAQVPAHRGGVPDLDRRQERPAAPLDQPGGRGSRGRREGGQLGDRAGRRDFPRAVGQDRHGRPVHAGEVHEPAQVWLGLGEQVRATRQPRVAGPPFSPLPGVAHLGHRVQVHARPPPAPPRSGVPAGAARGPCRESAASSATRQGGTVSRAPGAGCRGVGLPAR